MRTYQLGQYAGLSQRILNELASAKAWLLDPAKKAAYDALLRAPIPSSTQASAVAEDVYALAVPPRTVSGPSFRDYRCRSHCWIMQRVSSPTRRPSIPRWLPTVAAGGAVVVLLLAVGLVVPFSGGWKALGSRKVETRLLRRPANHAQPMPTTRIASLVPRSVVRPPKLAPIPDQTIDEVAQMRFTVQCSDPRSLRRAGQTLQYTLAAGAPGRGGHRCSHRPMHLDTDKKPSSGKYPITVQIQFDEPESVGDKTTFCVTVRKVNRPPIIHPIAMQTVRAGSTYRFTFAITAAGPSDKIAFSLSRAPPGYRLIRPREWSRAHLPKPKSNRGIL